MEQDPAQTAKSLETEPATPEPFWRKPLAALTIAEWESLCDGCGRCCLVKLEDDDKGDIHFTDVSCVLLDTGSCRCSDYAHRQAKVPDCVKLTPDIVQDIPWLPPTCAYRLVEERRDLAWWHPLVSGRPETVHEAGISVRGRVSVSEDKIDVEDIPGRITTWPARWPKRSRKAPRTPAAKVRSAAKTSMDEPPVAQNPVDPGPVRPEP